MDARISQLSAIEFVNRYLIRTKGVLEWSFVTLWVTQGEHSEATLEKQIRDWEQEVATDPTADYAQVWLRSVRNNFDSIREERSAYGETFLEMAAGAVAGSIISIAHQGIRLGEQRGAVREDRIVHEPYRLRDFVRLSRDHGAHFWESVTKANEKRLAFQREVLGYDQLADGTHINHSVALLDKLGWRWYDDVEADLIKLFEAQRV